MPAITLLDHIIVLSRDHFASCLEDFAGVSHCVDIDDVIRYLLKECN